MHVVNCKKPDRDCPGIICGHSLPCPYHTVVLDRNDNGVPQVCIPATIAPDIDSVMLSKLKEISRILHKP